MKNNHEHRYEHKDNNAHTNINNNEDKHIRKCKNTLNIQRTNKSKHTNTNGK